jgi:flagellar biosynthetic protein FliR
VTAPDNPIYAVFIVFCRIGGCLMVAPGFSSDRVPIQARLYLAIAITLALAPALLGGLPAGRLLFTTPFALLTPILAELSIGVTLGFMARCFFLALETLLTAVSMAFGLGNIFGAAVTEPEPVPALSSFVMVGAMTLVFVTDLHLEMIRALFLSYEATPIFTALDTGALLDDVSRILTQSHLLALRICSPFLLFALIVNLALGLLARLTPQVQIYFIMTPAIILLSIGGFFLLGWDFFSAFVSHFGAWIERG